jgi:glycosyltransferase involved in cell wall biosynthesis
MASGTPVVCSDDAALREVAGDAGIYGDLVEGIQRALAERERFARAGIERARAFTWSSAATRTADVYRQVLA